MLNSVGLISHTGSLNASDLTDLNKFRKAKGVIPVTSLFMPGCLGSLVQLLKRNFHPPFQLKKKNAVLKRPPSRPTAGSIRLELHQT